MEPGWYPHPQDPNKQIYWTGTTWNTTGPIDSVPAPPIPPISAPPGIHHKLSPATGVPQYTGVYSPSRQNTLVPVQSRAGFWIRFGSLILDSLIMAIPLGLLFFVGSSIIFSLTTASNENYEFDFTATESASYILLSLFLSVLLSGLTFGYLFLTVKAWGATPGQRIAGIKIVNEDGTQVSVEGNFKRNGYIVGLQLLQNIPIVGPAIGVVILVGDFWVLGSDKRTFQDYVAKTFIVDARYEPSRYLTQNNAFTPTVDPSFVPSTFGAAPNIAPMPQRQAPPGTILRPINNETPDLTSRIEGEETLGRPALPPPPPVAPPFNDNPPLPPPPNILQPPT